MDRYHVRRQCGGRGTHVQEGCGAEIWRWIPNITNQITVYSGTSTSTTTSHKLRHPLPEENFSRITRNLKVISVQATIPPPGLERAQEKFWTQHSFLRLSVPLESARSFEQFLGQHKKRGVISDYWVVCSLSFFLTAWVGATSRSLTFKMTHKLASGLMWRMKTCQFTSSFIPDCFLRRQLENVQFVATELGV